MNQLIKSSFCNNDFTFIFIEENVISILGIQYIRSLRNKSNIPLSSDFTTTQEFHFFHEINNINEIIKYITNDFNYINISIESIEMNEGDEIYEGEQH